MSEPPASRMSLDQARRFLQSTGGHTTYQRGPRKGRTKDLTAMRREVSRVRACKRLGAQKANQTRKRKEARVARELRRLQ